MSVPVFAREGGELPFEARGFSPVEILAKHGLELLMPPPPSGTVTFLFTDIQGSTKLWEQAPDAMRPALARHDALLRRSIEDNGGCVFKTVGDAFCAAFPTGSQALEAALAAQFAFGAEAWETEAPLLVRMALHAGDAEERGGDYFGQTLNRVARLMATGHGGQTLLSGAVYETVEGRLPPSVTLLDLGRHRLKDLGRPERVFQVCHPALPAGFGPLRSLDNLRLPNNLPQQPTSFVGRETQVAEVKSLLTKTRLLTLTGMGGTGKTRLSLQVAADLLDGEGDGVWLVELAALPDPALVAQAVAEALGVREEAGQTITQTLIDWLKPKRLLIVLDNCEHLVGACASLAAQVLKHCPGVHLLASSREALNVMGEQVYRVPALAQSESVRLFAERAQTVQPSFLVTAANMPAVSAVCSRLDGIPLALELAAARVRSLPVEEINTRLDSRFRLLTGGSRTALPRQQTLRALVDWSYDLLTAQEKAVLRRLSVFAGGWTLAAAEGVCSGEDIEDWEVLDLLTSLLDKSLVIYDERTERYGLLETVRQYAKDRGEESGEVEAVRGRAAAWFLNLAREANPKLEGPEASSWLSRLETEHDNLRASLAFFEHSEEGVEPGLSLAVKLSRFWVLRGHVSEGRRWLGRALERVQDWKNTADQKTQEAAVMAFYFAGSFAAMQDDHAAAEAMLKECLAIWRRQGNRANVAVALGGLGMAVQKQGRSAAAQPLFEESLALWRQLGDKDGIAGSLNNLGNLAKDRGDYAAARPLLEEGLALARELGNPHLTAMLLDNLGVVALQQGDVRDARSLLADSLALKREMGDQWGVAYSLEGMAGVALAQNDFGGTACLLGIAAWVREDLGRPLQSADQDQSDRRAEAARAALGADAFAAAWEAGRAMTVEEAVDYALSA